ncbi:MAG TPA: glycoside hydrolase family 3 N-terminal domain-containing protein [Candidatus Kryptonia bacterium]
MRSAILAMKKISSPLYRGITRSGTFLSVAIAFLLLASEATLGTNSKPDTAKVNDEVERLLSQMTLAEKIGQMTQIDRRYLKADSDIKTYFLGSILSGGGSSPAVNTASSWADMCDRFQSYALQTRLKIPLLYGIDAVHGNNNVKGAVIFPHNIGMGCTRDPDLVEKAARVTAEEAAGTGVNWAFAPCIAVARDIRWGRTYESFGESTDLQVSMARAGVEGLQGPDPSDSTTVLACAKHFVGDGGTEGGKDQGITACDEPTLRKIHLPGYIEAIKDGVGSIMVSYSSWNGVKMTGNKYLLTDILKGELSFKGLLISDWAASDQLQGDYSTQIETAINSGMDMMMVPEDYARFISTVTSLVNDGKIPLSRIDDAVRRILREKIMKGIFEHPYTDRDLTSQVGSAAHREIARQCVRESLVLLKNGNGILPLSKNLKHIVVAGKNADDLGNQCGGWTISWQGSSGNITTGTTILQGIKNAVGPNTLVTYSPDGSETHGADVAIVVVGETPYTEGAGDRTDLSLSDEDLTAIENACKDGIPVIVVLVSGRPMIVNSALASCRAFVAAWLPGTEGEGVADVLFGDFKPTGKLSQSWPKSMDQIPLNYGSPNYDPLFPYGYGLTY